ncbi:Glutamine synthetase [Linum grandiflorum]
MEEEFKAINDGTNGSFNLDDDDKASQKSSVSLGFPAKRFNEVVTRSGAGLTYTCMAFPSYIDSPADGCNLVCAGEIRLMPDLSTKTKIPWMAKQEMVLSDMHVKPGEPWEYCPRGTLRRISKILKDEFDLICGPVYIYDTIRLCSRYALDDIGSGSHVHISLSRNGENVFMGTEASSSQHGISKVGREFMSGVLHHLPAILAFTAPVPNRHPFLSPIQLHP